LSADGLALGASSTLDRADADHLAALSAGFRPWPAAPGGISAAARSARRSIEMESGFLLVAAAGHGTCLAVLAEQSTDLGVVATRWPSWSGGQKKHLGVSPAPRSRLGLEASCRPTTNGGWMPKPDPWSGPMP